MKSLNLNNNNNISNNKTFFELKCLQHLTQNTVKEDSETKFEWGP